MNKVYHMINIMNTKIQQMKINKNYYIKPIFKYDIVLNSTNKTSKELVKELYQ